MTKVLFGERIGRTGKLRLGCSAAIFNENRDKILLTKRSDNGQWCLPGGAMEPGESAEDCCQREVNEETGLEVSPIRLVGVYSNPDQLVVYPDGNRVQVVVLHFEAQITGGQLGLSNETTEAGFFTLDEVEGMTLLGRHKERIKDTLAGQNSAFVR
jgi:ADP-ribose pyrophosphatase YjhB (NUDIX family)